MTIREIATPKMAAKQEAIDLLERWLNLAREGQITGLAIARTNADGSHSTTWTASVDAVALIGSVAVLQHRMLEQRERFEDRNP